MDILLTLPPNFAKFVRRYPKDFPGITGVYSDPEGHRLGSGGGTVHVLWEHYLNSEKREAFGEAVMNTNEIDNFVNKSENIGSEKREGSKGRNPNCQGISQHRDFHSWLSAGKRIVIHSDGQSRRLPAYAPIGKSFIPFPVFKWGRGQRIDQSLFDIQRPLLEKILEKAPSGLNTLVASGDALVRTDFFAGKIPEADVVCIGIWAQPDAASRHGVFVCPRHEPSALQYMLQKPSLETLQSLTGDFLYLLDAGIWLLSDRAVLQLFKASGWDSGKGEFRGEHPVHYDLYSGFGSRLGAGKQTTMGDQSVKGKYAGPGEGPGNEENNNLPLTVKIIPLEQAEFYHFGSNADLLKSTSALHNRILDQREIWHKKIKPNPDIFVQNSATGVWFSKGNACIWIENSHIPGSWTLHDHHILTGVPENDWKIDLASGTCLDFIPCRQGKWCIRPYGFNDQFKGNPDDTETSWLNHPAMKWFNDRHFAREEIKSCLAFDIYDSPLFPVLRERDITADFIQWLCGWAGDENNTSSARNHKKAWLSSDRLSAAEIIGRTDHSCLSVRRRKNMEMSLSALAENHKQSIFYQLDLKQLAGEFRKAKLQLPERPGTETDVMTRIHDLMFRSVYHEKHGGQKAAELGRQAFGLLREGMLENIRDNKLNPVMKVKYDQILWGRSPLRLDLAGGWTDTPPYCILYGGKVVNMAVELNGQPPIQVYIRPTGKPFIMIHSIDLGVSEAVRTYEDIQQVSKVGSAFAIPKAALMLAGFYPAYSAVPYKSLKDHLQELGCGLDISLMVAVPKGSGLGTSSILAATILGGLSDFCALGWDNHEVAYRTLLIEQLLTTGGGWQDQLGGILEGVKLIESIPGFVQKPAVSWAPDHLFTRPETSSMMLLYYTGITRVAKHILTDIVKGMFLNSAAHLGILSDMKHHARNTYEAIQDHNWDGLTLAIRHSWELNQELDPGTNTSQIQAILDPVKDYMVSCKLLGAGGGGYLLIFSKDLQAANRIRSTLQADPPNPRARFVDWKLSSTGLELTKS